MIRINGIRLSREMIQVRQDYPPGGPKEFKPVYRRLSQNRINMTCVGAHFTSSQTWFACCLEKNHSQAAEIDTDTWGRGAVLPEVCVISLYPHHSKLPILNSLIDIFSRSDIRFQHMVSSNSMLSFVIETRFQDRIISLLREGFLLPDSHTPFRQDLDEDISHLLKKYPETRAFYVEEKIKTYGFSVCPDLDLFHLSVLPENLAAWGSAMGSMRELDTRFCFFSALGPAGELAPEQEAFYDFALLTSPLAEMDRRLVREKICQNSFRESPGPEKGDLISFHGPHFGDRYRILDTAITCMDQAGLPILYIGCTGASISMVLPSGLGQEGKAALETGFEAP